MQQAMIKPALSQVNALIISGSTEFPNGFPGLLMATRNGSAAGGWGGMGDATTRVVASFLSDDAATCYHSCCHSVISPLPHYIGSVSLFSGTEGASSSMTRLTIPLADRA